MIHALMNIFSVGAGCHPPSFMGLKPWYHYLDTDSDCNVINFKVLDPAHGSDIMLVAFAIVDDMLRIAGFIAVGYIIYGGILYLTSQGSPDATGKAQSTIQNALIGLLVSIMAIALVTFLGNRIVG